MMNSPTSAPCPSTTALVARVVDTETRSTALAGRPDAASAAAMAPAMPRPRSWWVVGRLADATTRRVAASTSTASVQVPPVSTPMT